MAHRGWPAGSFVTGPAAAVPETAGTRWAAANTPHFAHTSQRSQNIVLNRIYSPSVTTLRMLLMAVSLVAMALAGSAGSHWG
jgi:hypothetical protein